MSDGNRAPAPSFSMSEAMSKKTMARTIRGKNRLQPPSYIDRRFHSLLDLLNAMRDAFPNNSELVSYHSPCKLDEQDVEQIRKSYGFPDSVKASLPGLGDRTCNWHPEKLCVYKGALEAGLRFPVDPFIIRLLAELQVHPCQLYPNAWRIVLVFMLR